MKITKKEYRINWKEEGKFYFGEDTELYKIYELLNDNLYKKFIDHKYGIVEILKDYFHIDGITDWEAFEKCPEKIGNYINQKSFDMPSIIEKILVYYISEILDKKIYNVEWQDNSEILGSNGNGDIDIRNILTNEHYIIEVKSSQTLNDLSKPICDDKYILLSGFNNSCAIGQMPMTICGEILEFSKEKYRNGNKVDCYNICKKIGIYVYYHGKYIDTIEIRPMPLFIGINSYTKDKFVMISSGSRIKCMLSNVFGLNPNQNFEMIEKATLNYLTNKK